ncbi:MAG: excinuclease ABC subunit UvrA [Pirellulaceae bacterium]
MSSAIQIVGARTHNLRNVDLEIPHNQLTVLTGVSGSGKSSLAIDTLYAEGQRQYIESLSTYARQFLNQLQKPDVELIEGLQPTLCIDQKSGTVNPRSTVATITEIYDYLRLLMARVGVPNCYDCGEPIAQQSPNQIIGELLRLPERTKIVLLAPVVRGRKGNHAAEIEEIRKAGLVRVRVNGETCEIDEVPPLALRKNHTIEAVVDRIVIREGAEQRLSDSVELALKLSEGLVTASYTLPSTDDEPVWQERLFSTLYSCTNCGVSYEELEPRTFSFNSPYGACPECEGVGALLQVDPDLLVTDWEAAGKTKAFTWIDGLSASNKRTVTRLLREVLEAHGLTWTESLSSLDKRTRKKLLLGDSSKTGLAGAIQDFSHSLDETAEQELEPIFSPLPCDQCHGARLRKEALSVRLGARAGSADDSKEKNTGKNIFDICSTSISEIESWIRGLEFDESDALVAKPILGEMLHRLEFLNKVGVGYLSLSRSADTLSGGELQRVRLATSIGSGLVGVSYILDEPSIGLHQRDNDRLIESLRNLQQQGNTVIVVEHDEAMMRSADLLVDVGPGAGKRGGHIVAAGKPRSVEKHANSLTGAFLRGDEIVWDKSNTRKPKKSQSIRLKQATLHNLKGASIDLPLELMVGITGVSGSGKSSLISGTLVPAIKRELGQGGSKPGPHKSVQGIEHVDKLIEINQTPIGRSPRSTPATFCGVWDLIRKVWANTRESKQRGYTASRFSFNAGPGRCPQCQGQGQEKIEMHFLPDLFVQCSVCGGKRFSRQTLQVRYRDKSIFDVLQFSVDEACIFFENFSKIHRLLSTLQTVGLGYLTLGQSSTTLSGGEAQRIKLASELAKQETGRTVYFLDEPTTGLHFADVRRLIQVLDGLVERGNTVIVIEHNLDVIKACDWLIDMGPEGGSGGGEVIVSGPPRRVAEDPRSLTGKYLS